MDADGASTRGDIAPSATSPPPHSVRSPERILMSNLRYRRAARALILSAAILTVSCQPYEEPLPRRDRLNFPIGLALHPNGRHLYVVNSNFDSRYDPDYGGTVAVVDTDTLQVRAESSPYIPSYGAYIELNEDASRAYVTARRGDSLVALDVSDTADGGVGSALTCPGEDGEPSSDPTNCTMRRVPDTEEGGRIPEDPFGLEVTTVQRTDGAGDPMSVDVISLSHIGNHNNVTSIAIPDGQLGAATMVNAALIEGGNQIARRPGTLEMYIAGRSTNRVAVFVPYVNASGEVEAIFARRNLPINNVTSNVDARGVAFSEAGDRLYVATRRPDAVHVFNIAPSDPETGAGTRHELARVIPLRDQPSDVVVHRTPEGDELLLIPCYDGRVIEVVDPERGVVLAEIELDESPYQLVTEQGPGRCQVPGQRCRGYVSLFADAADNSTSCDDSNEGCGSVAVLELDPASPRYLQVIAKIR